MQRLAALVFTTVLLLPLFATQTASAQSQFQPQIEVICDSSAQIEVHPGASRTGYLTCTAKNPTIYVEIVELDASVPQGFEYSIPDTITVGANDESSFQVTFRADGDTLADDYLATIQYKVTKANGIDCVTCEQEELNSIIRVLPFYRMQLDVNPTMMRMETGSVQLLNLTITNLGNDDDRYRLSINNQEELDEVGFRSDPTSLEVSVSLETGKVTETAEIRAPKELAEDANLTYTVEILIESKNSVRVYGTPYSLVSSFEVKVIPVDDQSLIGGAVSMLPGFSSAVTLFAIIGAALVISKSENDGATTG